MREETFGPVLPIMSFDSEDEAVRLANDSEYGLAASVWTQDRARGEALARRIAAGSVLVNDVVSCFGISEAPHGGIKSSGIGRTHGRFGLEEMVRIKYLASDRLPRMKKVWWYGYGEAFTRQMEGFLDMQFARNAKRRLQGALRSAEVLLREAKTVGHQRRKKRRQHFWWTAASLPYRRCVIILRQWRAICCSSCVGTIWILSAVRPRHSRPSVAADRMCSLCSPMPPVKTRRSTPPRRAAYAPMTLRTETAKTSRQERRVYRCSGHAPPAPSHRSRRKRERRGRSDDSANLQARQR